LLAPAGCGSKVRAATAVRPKTVCALGGGSL
jgi:hypothetical protein